MRRIMRLEAQVGGNHGGVIGETIRGCHMRLDGQAAVLEELQARIRARDWYHDLSEQEHDEEIRQIASRAEGQEANVENQSGVENRPFVRRRVRNHAPQRQAQRLNPRAPQVLHPLDEMGETTVSDDAIQQRMQRLAASGSTCSSRHSVRAISTSDSPGCRMHSRCHAKLVSPVSCFSRNLCCWSRRSSKSYCLNIDLSYSSCILPTS